MLKEYSRIFTKLMLVADLCIVTVSFFLAYALTCLFSTLAPLIGYIWILPVALIIWANALQFFDSYNSFRVKSLAEILTAVAKAAVSGFIILSSLVYVFKVPELSRLFIASIFAISGLLIGLEKTALTFFVRYIRKKGYNYRGFLVVGTGKRAQQFINLLDRHAEWGLKVVGLVDQDPAKKGEIINGHKIIGTFDDVPSIIHNSVIDEVVFVVPRSWLEKIEPLMRFCETEGIKINVAVDYFELKLSKAKQTELHGFPLLTFETTPEDLSHIMIKRFFDFIISAAALIVLAPFFLVIALIIKATSKGPVFFTQKRIGLYGRKFKLYKFRTMIENAEARLNDLLSENEMSGPVFKLADDPRLTRIGKFLRKFSIDELPQLWNVLKGEMSLVGPRPPLLTEVIQYDSWHRRRLSMRPGLTCLWQIKGRNKITDFDEWMKLDLEYIDQWSLWLDFKIIAKTLPVVLFGVGAK